MALASAQAWEDPPNHAGGHSHRASTILESRSSWANGDPSVATPPRRAAGIAAALMRKPMPQPLAIFVKQVRLNILALERLVKSNRLVYHRTF